MARARGTKDDFDPWLGFSSKDSSFGLWKIVALLIVFASGVIIGLASSSHVNRYLMPRAEPYHFNSPFMKPVNATGENCTIIKTYQKVDCVSMEAFLHPKQLIHMLSDEELFWRASLVPEKKEYPYPRLPKVAFMFLTRGSLPMLPLWERYFQGHEELFTIYVHALPGYELTVSEDSPFFRRQIPSQEVRWGTVTLADAERRLLANALLDFSNERFILLSESCVPVCNFPTAYKYLIESAHSFVSSYDDPSRYGRGRYSRSMLPDIKLFQWRKGSQWFELQRSLAIAIISDTKYYTIFKKYCLPACYPDEHYLPTYLNMFHASEIENRSVTWVDWSYGGPHPAAFGKPNVSESFIQAIRNNNGTPCSYNSEKIPLCYLFARKFSPSALGPLLNLSSTVMEI